MSIVKIFCIAACGSACELLNTASALASTPFISNFVYLKGGANINQNYPNTAAIFPNLSLLYSTGGTVLDKSTLYDFIFTVGTSLNSRGVVGIDLGAQTGQSSYGPVGFQVYKYTGVGPTAADPTPGTLFYSEPLSPTNTLVSMPTNIMGPGNYYIQFVDNSTYNDIVTNGELVNGDVFTSQVPEPATWSMMLIGFGLAGAILRRRNAQSTRAMV